MNHVERRMRKLESSLGEDGRLITVTSGGASDDEVNALLAAERIEVRPADRLLHFVTIYEDRDGNPSPNPAPPKLGTIVHLRRAA